jgi:hypothetical protein
MTAQNAAARRPCRPPPGRQRKQALHDKEQTTMTDQQILARPGEIAEDSESLGFNIYAYLDDGTLETVSSSPDMGQGPGALAWLTGNFFGPAGVTQIAQLWDNNGSLGLNVYGESFGFKTLFSAPDLGQGSGALAFLTGDFTGSGNDEIAQLWDNNGSLGVIGYGMADVTPQTVFDSPDLGQGSGALAFLAGDFTGSGHTEIAQLWEDNSNVGLIVYGYVNGTLQTVYSDVVGFKPDALAFLTGDFFGLGSTQIAQLRDDNGTLEIIVYGSTEGTPQLWFDLDMGQGSGALTFLAGNFTGSGNDEIAQLWDNNGNLALIVYGNVNGILQTVESDTDLFEGSGALAFLTGDFTGSGFTQIAQPWDNNGNLGLIIYGTDGFSVVALASSPDLGQGPGALAWLAGTLAGPGSPALIAQPWDN